MKLTMPSENDEVSGGRMDLDFPCGGASVGVGPLEWLRFTHSIEFFQRKWRFFCVILYVLLVTTELKLKDIQSKQQA